MAFFCFSFFLCCGSAAPFLSSSSSSAYHLVSRPLSSLSLPPLPLVFISRFENSSRLSPTPTIIPSPNQLLCKAAGYVFPDPVPEFAEAESNKFRTHLLEKLTKKKKDLFGGSIEEAVRVCTEKGNRLIAPRLFLMQNTGNTCSKSW